MRRITAVTGIALLLSATFVSADEGQMEVLMRFWDEAYRNVYPADLQERFSREEYGKLREVARSAEKVTELSPAINAFLEGLGVSHTRFYDDEDVDFYLFRSLFTTHELDNPKARHIGAQFARVDGRYVVREVLNGYPADLAGIRRGDVIDTADGEPFDPYHAFNPVRDEPVRVSIVRNGRRSEIGIRAVFDNPNRSMHNAMRNSASIMPLGIHEVAYVRLWSGTHPDMLQTFERLIFEELGDYDALILDLRGGFGGAGYEYLDLFFPDRSGYPKIEIVDNEGRRDWPISPRINERYYRGPMVVLINEGTRSGKEMLAYQFVKSERATVIGTTTRGAFTLGRAFFTEPELDYFLLLSTGELLLDGNRIEGVGVEPHHRVEYSLDATPFRDLQMYSAMYCVSQKLRESKDTCVLP